MAKLSEICDIKAGGTPSRAKQEYWNENISWVKISDFNGKYVDVTSEKITEEGLNNSSAKMIEKGSILYTIFATLGEVAILNIDATTNQAIAALTPDKSQVDTDYLYYFLFSLKDYVNEIGRGVAQNNINMSILKNIEIPLPPLETQRQIAANLDKVTHTIDLCNAILEKLDLLVKSRFVEMFGEPSENPYRFNTESIGKIIKTIEAGWSGNGKQRERKQGEIAVLKVSAVTKGYFIPDECKVLDDQENIKKFVYPQKGDLLFSRANTREMVGATAVIKEDYPELILPDKLWKIRLYEFMEVEYVKQVLSSKSIRDLFSAASTGTSGSMYNVSMDKLKRIVIPVPPLELQQQFAAFIAQTDKSKLAVKKLLEKAETLKKSLMQEYFE